MWQLQSLGKKSRILFFIWKSLFDLCIRVLNLLHSVFSISKYHPHYYQKMGIFLSIGEREAAWCWAQSSGPGQTWAGMLVPPWFSHLRNSGEIITRWLRLPQHHACWAGGEHSADAVRWLLGHAHQLQGLSSWEASSGSASPGPEP